ncbi:unnamed protein product, partial [Laminaria digitata]
GRRGAGRRRPRDSAVDRGGFPADVGVSTTTTTTTTSCPATRLPSAEEDRPLGLLYDAALLKKTTSRNGGGGVGVGVGAGAGVKGDAAVSSVSSVSTVSTVSSVSGVSMSGEGEASVETTDLFERMTEDSGDNLTARWASVVNGAMPDTTTATATATTTTMTPPAQQRRQQKDPQQQQQQQYALMLESGRTTAPVVSRKKWSGKGWVGIGASW